MSTLIGLSVLDSSLYIPELRAKRRDTALQEMVAHARRAGAERESGVMLETLSLRERLWNTAVGKSVAIPSVRSIAVVDSRIVVARSRRGVDWNAIDEIPVQIVLLVCSPAEASEDAHHDLVARAASAVRLQRNRQKLLAAENFDAVAAVLREVTH